MPGPFRIYLSTRVRFVARYSISLHQDLANGLPKIVVDRAGLQQVLMNLMLNGIGDEGYGCTRKAYDQFTPKRGRPALGPGSGHGDWIATGERGANL